MDQLKTADNIRKSQSNISVRGTVSKIRVNIVECHIFWARLMVYVNFGYFLKNSILFPFKLFCSANEPVTIINA